jgi:hypothetical protein
MKLSYWLLFHAIYFSMGSPSYAQEDQSDDSNLSDVASKMELDENFFDALRLRTDLDFESPKRILYTTISDIKAFRQQYKGTEMSLEFVIRDRLHTAIFLDQKKNLLQSMDGSEFGLPKNITADELTRQLVALIGGMYYGAQEVRALNR